MAAAVSSILPPESYNSIQGMYKQGHKFGYGVGRRWAAGGEVRVTAVVRGGGCCHWMRLWSLYMFSRRATAAYWSGCLTMLYRVVQSFGLRCALLSNKSKPSSVIKRQTYFPNVACVQPSKSANERIQNEL